jgi:putative transposase
MPQSLVENYIHVVFSTKNREPIITDVVAPRLFEYVSGICRNLECPTLRVGGYLDHIHILCMLSKKLPLVKFMQEIKVSSSKWIKGTSTDMTTFQWQEGYAAFSVSKCDINQLATYIDNQICHHTTFDFKSELLTLLTDNKVKFDERYLWD